MYIEHKYIVKGVSALPLNLDLFYIIYKGLRYHNIFNINKNVLLLYFTNFRQIS